MRGKRRGLTMIEVLITIVVLVVGILVIVSSFSMNLRQSTQTRERLLADLVVENLVEEVLAHPFGDPTPASWENGEVEFEFVVEGRPQQSKFDQTVTSANGSFFGKGNSATDRVTITVDWTEATNVGDSGQNRSLDVSLTVRRSL